MATYCSCGCGEEVADGRKWRPGHWARSPEGRAQSSARLKGKTPWNKGVPRTTQEKENIRAAILQHSERLSAQKKEEHARGVYAFMRTDANVSKRPEVAAKIGHANAQRTVTDVTKEKIRNARIGKPGPVVSDKVRAQHSERMKRDNPMSRREVAERHPVLRGGCNFRSVGEDKLAMILGDLGIQYERQKLFASARCFYSLDFYLPKTNQCIEFDGHYTHQDNPKKDADRDAYLLEKYDIVTLRLVPTQLNNRNRETLKALIREFYGSSCDQDKVNQTNHQDGASVRPYRRRSS